MDKTPDAVRRRVGLLFLTIALILLLLGMTVLKRPLGKGIVFLLYWLACIAFTGLALLNALLDMVIVGSRARRERNDLAKRTLTGEHAGEPEESRE